MNDNYENDPDYSETDYDDVIIITDSETGEEYYRHPFTGKKIYVEAE